MPTKEIVSDTESKMKKALEVLHDEMKTVRTGRASTALVENIKADYYGTPTPLKQMAAPVRLSVFALLILLAFSSQHNHTKAE